MTTDLLALRREPSLLDRITDTYVARAFFHPLHAVALASVVLTAACTASALPLLVGAPIAELLALGAVPRLQRFRQGVDRARERAERAARERERSKLRSRMTTEHRDVLGILEERAASMRARLGDDAQARRDTHMPEVEELIDAYAALAARHDEATFAIARSIRDALDERAAAEAGEDAQRPDAPPSVVLAHLRRCRDANDEKLAAIRLRMATLVELVELMHDRALVPGELLDVDARIDELLEEIALDPQ